MTQNKETNEGQLEFNRLLHVTDEASSKLIDFYLIDEIDDIRDYIDFLRELDTAQPEDRVRLHINCYGGDMRVAWNIYDALRKSEADVHVLVEGPCMSAATIIMLAGNSWRILQHACVMIHAWSGWNYGKWNEQQAYQDFSKKVVEKQFREAYVNFLTPEEIELCIQGKDFYFDADEVAKRLGEYQKENVEKQQLLEELQEKYQDIIDKEVQDILEGKVKKVEKPKTKQTLVEKIAKRNKKN